jgi:predicted porin
MKKSLLALAVLGAFAGAAQAQSSVTIYGIVDTGVVYQSKAATGTGGTGSKFSVNSGVIQGSRIGFKGAEDLDFVEPVPSQIGGRSGRRFR